MDTVTPEVRSRMMRMIRGKHTKPEMIVRSAIHRRGLRFRLHPAQLSGSPDLVLPRHRITIFVHGCFWHRHDCKLAATPKSRTDFWEAKFTANKQRDLRNKRQLEESGWKVLIIWECETRDPGTLDLRLAQLLRPALET
jgi:DNA mismatch endonuclease (patch repair protein)